MKKYFFGANWKMNMSLQESDAFFQEWLQILSPTSADIVFFPTQHLLGYLQSKYGHTVSFGAQNVSFFPKGAFTGEITAELLMADRIGYSLVGHSERRSLMGETDDDVAKKIHNNQKYSVENILCVGESLEIRESGKHIEFVCKQLSASLKGVSMSQRLVVAYEPIWAIGTGKTATSQDIEEIHSRIYEHLEVLGFLRNNLSIIYGGSVNSRNAKEILALPHVDGVLVGGASLKVEEFQSIVKAIQ